MDAERKTALEGVAAIAITACQMRETDDQVDRAIRDAASAVGVDNREDLMLVAEAIRQFPQPEDLPADERERRRFIDELVGIPSAEDELAALLRARDIVLRIANGT